MTISSSCFENLFNRPNVAGDRGRAALYVVECMARYCYDFAPLLVQGASPDSGTSVSSREPSPGVEEGEEEESEEEEEEESEGEEGEEDSEDSEEVSEEEESEVDEEKPKGKAKTPFFLLKRLVGLHSEQFQRLRSALINRTDSGRILNVPTSREIASCSSWMRGRKTVSDLMYPCLM